DASKRRDRSGPVPRTIADFLQHARPIAYARTPDWSNCSTCSCQSWGMKTRIQRLQGVARLAGDGTLGTIEAAEGMHLAIVSSVAGRLPFGHAVARGTAFTYACVRSIARLTRHTTDGALAIAGRYARDDARG